MQYYRPRRNYPRRKIAKTNIFPFNSSQQTLTTRISSDFTAPLVYDAVRG